MFQKHSILKEVQEPERKPVLKTVGKHRAKLMEEVWGMPNLGLILGALFLLAGIVLLCLNH